MWLLEVVRDPEVLEDQGSHPLSRGSGRCVLGLEGTYVSCLWQ